MMAGRNALLDGSQFNIGNVKCIRLGHDMLLPKKPPRAANLKPDVNPNISIQVLLDTNTKRWREEMIQALISDEDHILIHQIYVSNKHNEDSLIWGHTTNGIFYVKTRYHFSIQTKEYLDVITPLLSRHPALSQAIWDTTISPKLKHFLWRMSYGALATHGNLQKRGMNVNPFCPPCCTQFETTNHIFFICSFAHAVWRSSNFLFHGVLNPLSTVEDNLLRIIELSQQKNLYDFIKQYLFWILWRL